MNQRPLISVVVPIYNAEKFLHKCVDSILAQSYRPLEVILVDDGSTDGSPAICDAYATKDPRVRAVHQENGGVSAARNRGTQASRGDYVCYVDADDYVDADLLQRLYGGMEEGRGEISVCGVRFEDAQGGLLPPKQEPVRAVLTGERALETMLYQKMFYASPWAKLIKKELAEGEPFPLGTRYEDLATTYRWLSRADRVAVDTRPGYHYVQHGDSFMGSGFHAGRFAQLDVADEMYAFIEEQHPKILPAARARRFAAYCQVLLAMPEDEEGYREQRRRILETMREDAPLVVRDPNCRKKDRIAAGVFCLAGEKGLRRAWGHVQKDPQRIV